jgi:hypothetical protein
MCKYYDASFKLFKVGDLRIKPGKVSMVCFVLCADIPARR